MARRNFAFGESHFFFAVVVGVVRGGGGCRSNSGLTERYPKWTRAWETREPRPTASGTNRGRGPIRVLSNEGDAAPEHRAAEPSKPEAGATPSKRPCPEQHSASGALRQCTTGLAGGPSLSLPQPLGTGKGSQTVADHLGRPGVPRRTPAGPIPPRRTFT